MRQVIRKSTVLMYRDRESRDPDKTTMLVCERGHKITGLMEYARDRPAFCTDCSAPTISACKECGAPIPGDAAGLSGSTKKKPPTFCGACGKPFPWQSAAIDRARRVAKMQAEINELDESVAGPLADFAEQVATNNVSPDEADTFGRWFTKKAGIQAAKAVGTGLKDVATDVIAAVITKTMLGGG
jgi:hypothetical protein